MQKVITQTAPLLKSLTALPCFNQVTRISAITGGFSHACFKVEADGACYFAKMTTGIQLETELTLAKVAALNKLTPPIFYHDEQWLVSHYIEGENLAVKEIPLIEKIATSIKLMITFHQLTASSSAQVNVEKISTLSIAATISDLFHPNNQPTLVTKITMLGSEIAALIAPEMSSTINNLLCCHSDMNFSNVLTSNRNGNVNGNGNNRDAWLIDFEYACFAPAEFDLAMLIAVNNIPLTLTDDIIGMYERGTDRPINQALLHAFILFCYLINGLWYFNSSFDEMMNLTPEMKAKMYKLATEQWQSFDTLYCHLNLSKSPIILMPFISPFGYKTH